MDFPENVDFLSVNMDISNLTILISETEENICL